MASIRVEAASLSYPIYNMSARSVRSHLVSFATGGLAHQSSPRTVLVDALRRISIELVDGDRLGLVGPNGAGKSTLLRLLAGVYQPDTGRIERQGRIETLFDLSLGMDIDAKGYDNIRLMAAIRGFDHDRTQRILRDVTEFSELGDYLSLPIRTYSSGMVARLGFSIATAAEPEILLIDEVLGVGDQYFLRKANDRLRRMADESHILVLASHSAQMVREFCTKCAIMQRGRIVDIGPSEEILSKYEAELVV